MGRGLGVKDQCGTREREVRRSSFTRPFFNTIPLDDPQPRWYSLQDRTEPLSEELAVNGTSYRGEIIVALKFLPPNSSSHSSKKLGRRSSNSKGTLLILVKEAKNLVSP